MTDSPDAGGGRRRRGIAPAPENLPPVSPFVLRWFTWYSRRYLRKQFHSLRVSKETLPQECRKPLVIFLNHAAWWDPLVLLVLTKEFFPAHTFFAPMDSRALVRYGVLRRIGCFGVELGTARGAKQFLGAGLAALDAPDRGLCLTPQGRFADVRERPVQFQPGLAQIAQRAPDALFLPLALEYPFWEERSPEVLARFGESFRGAEVDGKAPLRFLEERLTDVQNALAADALVRDPSRFSNLLRGKTGVGGVYDLWRRCRSWLRRERFVPEHSSL